MQQQNDSLTSAPHRQSELDGLRAIAATMVLLYHCSSAVGLVGNEVQHRLLIGVPGAIANGSSAVILFFALSGYVLTGSFLRDTSAAGAAAFLVRRVLRLYPAYLAALVLAWSVSLVVPFLEHGDGQSAFVRAYSDLHLGPREMLLSALMPGFAFGLVPVGWTLRIELVYSIAFPALMWLALRTHVGVLVLVTGISLLVTPSRLLNYAFPFTVGMAMYLYRDRLRVSDTFPATARYGLLAGAAVAYFLPPFHLWPVSRLAGIGLSTLGSSGLMLLAPLPPLTWLLRSRAMVHLGEISYSLYLLHVPVVLLASPFVLTDAPAADEATAIARWLALTAVVLPVTILLSMLSYRWVEAPSIEAGRRLARLLSHWR